MKMWLASDVYREGFNIRLEYNGMYWAHVWYDPDKEGFVVFLGRVGGPDSDEVILPLDEMQAALEQAKQRLISEGMGSPTK